MAALVLPAGAFGQVPAAPRRDAPARPAAGSAVVSYEESRGGAIVYLEESGGLSAQGAQNATPRRSEPALSAAPVAAPPAAPARAPATRNTRLVTRQLADADTVAPRR